MVLAKPRDEHDWPNRRIDTERCLADVEVLQAAVQETMRLKTDKNVSFQSKPNHLFQ